MKATKAYIMICALCTASIAGNLLSAVVAAAQEPKVSITAAVQNQTTNSALANADTKESALAAKPGDILKYVVTITNQAEATNTNENDFVSTKLTSALPAGLELVSSASREINEDLGIIKPGKSIKKEYVVRAASRDGDTLESKACFTGRYEAQNKAQSDCESAFVAVAPPEPETTTPPTDTKPQQNQPAENTPGTSTPQQSEATNEGKSGEPLPTTGPSDWIAPLAAVTTGGLTYIGSLMTLKRRGQ